MIWDVVVVGAGPAGAVAGKILAKAGRRVLLVDDVGEAKRKVGESLPGSARPLLRDLGLLEGVEGGPHLQNTGRQSAWGSTDLRTLDALREPHGPGWNLDRAHFDAGVRRSALASGAVWCQLRVRSVSRDGEGWRLGLRRGELKTRWLVDASGRRAMVARGVGVKRCRDDSLVAVCAWMAPRPGDLDRRTLVEAVSDGWWYSALLPEGIRVVVFHGEGHSAARLLRQPDAWQDKLAETQHLRELVGGAEVLDGPRATEACGAHLERFGGRGWLAVGDAALSFDPLSSQGMLNALYTGFRGGEAVLAALDGRPGAVQGYADRLTEIRRAYRDHHHVYYRQEGRWPEQSFWARRQRPSAYGKRVVSMRSSRDPQLVQPTPSPTSSTAGR